MIKKDESLLCADAVLNFLERLLGEDPESHIYVSCWSNSREQGYYLYNSAKMEGFDSGRYRSVRFPACLVAQQRSSDNILVIMGSSDQFDSQSHQPSEEVWEDGRVEFSYNEPAEAAQVIAKHLVETDDLMDYLSGDASGYDDGSLEGVL